MGNKASKSRKTNKELVREAQESVKELREEQVTVDPNFINPLALRKKSLYEESYERKRINDDEIYTGEDENIVIIEIVFYFKFEMSNKY
jgi:hypothetical protein